MKEYLKKMKYSYTKIDAYLRCRLEFYFKYVLGLDEKAEAGKEFSGSEMGSFVHAFLQTVFHEGFKKEKLDDPEFKESFFSELEKMFAGRSDLKAREDAFLIKKVLDYRMGNLLEFEKNREYDSVYRCEKKYNAVIGSGGNEFNLECVIDRIDRKKSAFVILDYKTGKSDFPILSKNFEALSEGFSREKIKKAVKSFQLPLYKYIFERAENTEGAVCGIYNVKKPEIFELFSNIENEEKTQQACLDAVKNILEEISGGSFFEFDPKDGTDCKNCKFFYICR